MGSRFKGDTQDPAVNVTTFLFIVIMVFSVATRLGTKFHLFRRLMVDDFLILASLLFGVGQGIAIAMAVSNGYGYHYATLSNERLDGAMKSLYAGSLLYILSLTCSKLSLAIFIRNLTPSIRDRRLALIVQATIGVWAVVTFFWNAFECSVPRTWAIWDGKCPNMLTWRYFVAGSNIVTDLLLILQVVFLVLGIQTTTRRRMMFAAIFLPRLVVPIALVVQITTIRKGTETTDPTYQLTENTIIEGVVQCLSIVTACWGQLRPFMSWMRSNGLRIQDDETTSRAYTGSKMRTRKTARSGASHNPQDSGFSLPMRRDQILVTQDWDVNSQSSRANIIVDGDGEDGDKNNPRTWTNEAVQTSFAH